MLERPRTQHYAQVLMAFCSLVMLVAVGLIAPDRVTPLFVLGVVAIVAGAVVMYVVWRAQPMMSTRWIAIVPLADILAVVPMRDAASAVLPTVGIIVIFPIGWLAFAFPRIPIVIGVVLTALVPLPSVFRQGAQFDSPGDWLQFVALPITMALYAMTIRIIASDLRSLRGRARTAAEELDELLRVSGRDGAVLQTLTDTIDDAVALFDPRGTPLLLNEGARALMANAGVATLNDPRVSPRVREADGVTAFETGPELVQRVRRGELAAPHLLHTGPPDDQRTLRVTMRPVARGDEEFGLLAIGQDITELVHAVEVRDRFLGTVGHEFRTPLTVILGQADLALMGDPVDRARWEAVERAGERLLGLVERLIAAGQADVQTQGGTARVAEVVRRAVAELTDESAGRGIRVTVDGDEVLTARIGPRDLDAIVSELVRNALRFTPDGGGDVRVAFRAEADSAVVDVVDIGIGMTPTERTRAFERFYRAPHAHRAAVPGAGLGLPLVSALAAANGGTIVLAANEPAGTRATLRVPLARTPRGA
ncbi:sensor histidine kinase [Microbacterium sp. 179-B 1A2 NHS]|uniref:sensor histidine kinase n=1 Tax=Microbacterium sp. 179-B 1A2 NHS TaxID=3142383 RepID=UPI0039A02CED